MDDLGIIPEVLEDEQPTYTLFAVIATFLIGIAFGMIGLGVLHYCDNKIKKEQRMHECWRCHVEPPLIAKNLKGYKELLEETQTTRSKSVAAQLEGQQYIINKITQACDERNYF